MPSRSSVAGDDIDDLRLCEFGDELPRQVTVRLVGDGRLQVPYVGIDRVAEQQHLHDGQADDHAEGQPVAAELPDLLPDDRQQPG